MAAGEAPAPLRVELDLVNEQVVLVAALVDDKARAALTKRIRPDLFLDEQHQRTWSALRELVRRKLQFAIPTLVQLGGGAVDADYLATLVASYPSIPPNVRHHVAAMRWDHAKAETVRGPLNDLIKAVQSPSETPERVRALVRAVDSSLGVHVDRQFMRDPVLLADEQAKVIQGRRAVSVYPFGIQGLDTFEDGTHRLIPGVAPGKTTIITGVSGSGKSLLAALIALAQARRRRRVLFGAWEMGAGVTLELMAQISLGWSRYAVSTGSLSDDDLGRLRERMEQIGTYVRFFDAPFDRDPGSRHDNDQALDEIHRYVSDSGAEVAIFDLWERAIPDGDPGPERRALFRQQTIAEETGCHCVLVAQQRLKEVERRTATGCRPARDTILGSSAWVDIGDTILGTHRPHLWKPAMPDDTFEVLVLKQRFHRWPLAVEFDWDGDRVTMLNGRSIEVQNARGEANELLSKFTRGGR